MFGKKDPVKEAEKAKRREEEEKGWIEEGLSFSRKGKIIYCDYITENAIEYIEEKYNAKLITIGNEFGYFRVNEE